MKKLLIVTILSAMMFAFAACAPATPTPAPTTAPSAASTASPVIGAEIHVEGGTYLNVSPSELKSMLVKKDFTFVNVHIPFEGNIANTDTSIAYNEIGQKLDQLPADKDAKIVLYCRSGRMSTEAAQTLVKLGYTNVSNLDGGMIAWQQAGFGVEDK